ncbi:GGDEF domain-containing protein [Arhodomonas sp. AD133]|uniref:GGDEF domain-containing protein n=1 Tax=Arhodomonas sp. AD133 TaxID=3415009 RepID=UPI003EBD77FF
MNRERQEKPIFWEVGRPDVTALAGLGETGLAWLLALQQSERVDAYCRCLVGWLREQAGVSALRFVDDEGVVRFESGTPGTVAQVWRLPADAGYNGTLLLGIADPQAGTAVPAILAAAAPLLTRVLCHERAVNAARRDPLTGLHNRAVMEVSLEQELSVVTRHETDFSILVIDVDDFKGINDRWGHRAGDAVLSRVADCLCEHCRECDLAFRFAGDEFVIGLRHTDEAGAHAAGRRIKRALESAPVVHDGASIPLTVSLGVAHASAGETVALLFDRADRDMYAAKARRRALVADVETRASAH